MDVHVFIVWIKMYEGDTLEVANGAAEQLGLQPHVTHFYDPDQLVGRAVAESFDAPEGKIAWDIYLYYGREDDWGDRVPQPIYWAHQIQGSSWADPSHLYLGANLTKRLTELTERLI
ncbi:MAG: hypothetical protein GTO14_00190 [Anaerolineales bacterium]|nr:hypothetical protein [Anaerolineales bacterium]